MRKDVKRMMSLFLPQTEMEVHDMTNITEMKAYEELEFRDDFMFGVTMEDKELCHDVIECLTGEPVGELSDVVTQKEVRFTSDGKPIRLDIYTKDENAVYDAEMQNLNKKSVKSLQLPRRSRFYQASIDIDYLNKNNRFSTLPDSKILFICTFDPFGEGLSEYTFRERCDECPDLLLSDGTEKHFYNCCYEGEDIGEDLRKLYEYINKGTISSGLTQRIDDAVRIARKNEVWRSAYMKERTIIMDAIEEERIKAEEANKRAEEANKRAEEDRKKTAEANKRAEEDRKRAEKAEARVKELEALLADRKA